MFEDICATLNWIPISSSPPNISSQLKTNDKHLLLNEIIECRQLGYFQVSLNLARSGLDHFPNDPALLDNIARVYQKLNRHPEAIELWKKILASNESAPNLKRTALKFILKDNNALTEFIITNSRASIPMNQVLKKLVNLSIQKRKSRDYDGSFEFLEHAWSDSFVHPALVDNFARIQFAKGFKLRSLYCFHLLKENAENKYFKSSAIKFLEENQSECFGQLHKDVQKICHEFDQSIPPSFEDIESFWGFVDSRFKLGKQLLPDSKVSLFNTSLFRYIERNHIISPLSHEMFFDSCLNLNYIYDADKFYQQNQHNFAQSSQIAAMARLKHSKEVHLPACLGEINNQLIKLANKEGVESFDLDIASVDSFEDLVKKCTLLLKECVLTNPTLTLKLFDQFNKARFLSPDMYKIRGTAYALLGHQDQAISDFHEYVSFIDGSVNVLELSVPIRHESSLIIKDGLKKDIYRLIDQKDYLSASKILAEYVLHRCYYLILKNPDLISLTFDHKRFSNLTNDKVKRDLVDRYAEINFYDHFIEAAKSLMEKND